MKIVLVQLIHVQRDNASAEQMISVLERGRIIMGNAQMGNADLISI